VRYIHEYFYYAEKKIILKKDLRRISGHKVESQVLHLCKFVGRQKHSNKRIIQAFTLHIFVFSLAHCVLNIYPLSFGHAFSYACINKLYSWQQRCIMYNE
jgi:hypothetical protein